MFFSRGVNSFSGPPRSVLVIEHGRMPTTDYFVLPKARSFGVPVTLLDGSRTVPSSAVFSAGTLAIFVRYIDAPWKKAVLQAKEAGLLAGIAYFIDDDLLDSTAWKGVPDKYGSKLRRLAPEPRWLIRHRLALWVASRYLQEKYRDLAPELIDPRPDEALYACRTGTTIFYHGTASHHDEIHWLVPVIRQVQSACDGTLFEIFGDLAVNRLYRDIPRTAILHPMGWDNYREYSAKAGRQIGLVPLLDTPFNAARSITKFFDVARCGAVGIYSDREPFRSFIREGVDGFLVANDQDAWVQRIVSLVNDPELCRHAAANARQRALSLSRGHDEG